MGGCKFCPLMDSSNNNLKYEDVVEAISLFTNIIDTKITSSKLFNTLFTFILLIIHNIYKAIRY